MVDNQPTVEQWAEARSASSSCAVIETEAAGTHSGNSGDDSGGPSLADVGRTRGAFTCTRDPSEAGPAALLVSILLSAACRHREPERSLDRMNRR